MMNDDITMHGLAKVKIPSIHNFTFCVHSLCFSKTTSLILNTHSDNRKAKHY